MTLMNGEPVLKQWCEQLFTLQFAHQSRYIGHMIRLLNKGDFLQQKSKYMKEINDIIGTEYDRFLNSPEYRYYLEDVRYRGKEMEKMSNPSEKFSTGKREKFDVHRG